LTGLGHAKVNHRLNQEVGIRKVSEATERELETRARAADRWIARLQPTRRPFDAGAPRTP
jgi:lysyl-tRNA synthetase class I